LAKRILEDAQGSEEVEVYVSRGKETSIRVFEANIEQLTAAESAGVGIRVISGGKQGFSYVGALDESAARDVLR
jgi:PmbA protein